MAMASCYTLSILLFNNDPKCALCYCHRMATQLQLTNILSYLALHNRTLLKQLE